MVVAVFRKASSQPPAYVPQEVEGFTLMSAEEQGWYNTMPRHFITNFNFDEVFLDEVGLWGHIRRCLSNLDIAVQCASTMRLDTSDDRSETITFRVRDEPHLIMVEGLSLLLNFDLDANEIGNMSKEELDSFWLYLLDVEERKPKNIKNPAIPIPQTPVAMSVSCAASSSPAIHALPPTPWHVASGMLTLLLPNGWHVASSSPA